MTAHLRMYIWIRVSISGPRILPALIIPNILYRVYVQPHVSQWRILYIEILKKRLYAAYIKRQQRYIITRDSSDLVEERINIQNENSEEKLARIVEKFSRTMQINLNSLDYI